MFLPVIVALMMPIPLLAADMPHYDQVAVDMKLQGSADDRKKAVRIVLSNTSQANASTLYLASLNAIKLNLLEDAGFLFYAAQMRLKFDMQRFSELTGNSGVGYVALNDTIGEVVNPAVFRNPKVFAAIVERLDKWDLATTKKYNPGWKSTKRVSAAAEIFMIKEIKKGELKSLRPLAKLLQEPEYFAAFITYQDFNSAVGGAQQNLERVAKNNAAMETILRIEKKKGLYILSDVLKGIMELRATNP